MDLDESEPMRARRVGTGVPDVMAVLFGVLSLGAVWMTVGEIKTSALARQSAHWAKVSGGILDARVHHVRRGVRVSWTCWYPVIRYAYTVGGRAYEGNRATFDESCSDANARDIVDRYRPGMQVDVFYDPNRPANSVLEPCTFKLHGVGSIVLCSLVAAMLAWMAVEQGRAAVCARHAQQGR